MTILWCMDLELIDFEETIFENKFLASVIAEVLKNFYPNKNPLDRRK